jgi:putative membrane protein
MPSELAPAVDPPAPAAPPPDAVEGRLHPLTVAFATIGIARRLVIPALGGGLAAGGGEADRIALRIGLFLTVPALIGAAARYAFFRYALHPDELVLRSGVLSRRHRVIPLSRVQNVDVRQGPLQRVFSVAELRVETAGTGA